MAELFDLSPTLRRERELSTSTSTGSAAVAGSIDPTNNRDTNWIGKGVDTNKQVDLCVRCVPPVYVHHKTDVLQRNSTFHHSYGQL